MSGKILVLGKGGQVGRALVKLLGERALAVGKENVDFFNPDFKTQLENFVKDAPLSAVINAAAYTQVDKAEGEGYAAAFRINGTAVGELAAWCKKRDLPLVHYSTDYVFDGSGDYPRREDEQPKPINAYGQSKLDGENAIMAQGGKYMIFRTSWVYDAYGKNFLGTILRLMHEKESLNVVADQVGAPTYAPHLARVTLSALDVRCQTLDVKDTGHLTSGIWHLCAGGATSWHGFALAIFTLATTYDSGIKCRQINPIPTSAYPLAAPRPLNSRLDCSKAAEILGIALPSWEAGLLECIREKYAGV